MELEGGCLCGAVRYKYSGEILRHAVCHCRDCQRVTGSVFHCGVVVAKQGFVVTRGQLRVHRAVGESGRWIDRSFCAECGSHILNELELRGPDYAVIKTGSLDNPAAVPPPDFEIFVKSRIPWVEVTSKTTKLDEMGPSLSRPA
jgi:hypothetical protein